MDKIEQEHHAIMFMYKAVRLKYGKLLEQMEDDVLHECCVQNSNWMVK